MDDEEDEGDEGGGGIDEVVIVNALEIEAPVSELVLESLFPQMEQEPVIVPAAADVVLPAAKSSAGPQKIAPWWNLLEVFHLVERGRGRTICQIVLPLYGEENCRESYAHEEDDQERSMK